MFLELSLRWETLAWARHTFAQTTNPACARCATNTLETHTDSCLGESHSPKRDGLSPKTKSPRLSEMLDQKEVYESPHISPRRSWLAWARNADSGTVSRTQQQQSHPKHTPISYHFIQHNLIGHKGIIEH